MSLKKLKFRLEGDAPMMMHNGQLVDPLNKYTKLIKELTAKRTKTDADHLALSHLEFKGGLYLNEARTQVVIPGDVIESMLKEAAKSQKLGKVFTSAVFCEGEFPLEYNGTKNCKDVDEKLWDTGAFHNTRPVRIGQVKIMRTRPIFKEWSVTVTVHYDDSKVNEAQVVDIMKHAGAYKGIGDYIPKYGRFVSEQI